MPEAEVEVEVEEFSPEEAVFEYTLRNHLRYRVFPQKGDRPPTCLVSVGALSSLEPKSPFQEAMRVAKSIRERTSRRIVVPLSGGVDSEAVALAFMGAGVEFQPIIWRFEDDLNLHDIRFAFEFCEKHGINPVVVSHDPVRFFSSGAYVPYMLKYRCRSPQVAVHLHLVEQIDGLCVLPWHPPILIKRTGFAPSLGIPGDYYLPYLRFFHSKRMEGVPYFFLYSPDLIASLMGLPSNLRAIQEPDAFVDDEYRLKVNTYREGGFDVGTKPQKYTGFEKVKGRFLAEGEPYREVFEDRFRIPYERKFGAFETLYHFEEGELARKLRSWPYGSHAQ